MEFFLIAAGVILFIAYLLMVVTHLVIHARFGHRVSYPNSAAENRFDAYQNRYTRQKHSFLSGKNRLTGYLYGEGNVRGLVVFAHGIGAGHESYIKEILWLVDHGWCVFAYDASGSCESEGHGTVGLVQSALDLDAALSYVENRREWTSLPLCVMGHSWGGYAAAAVLNFEHRVRASVSISGYNHPVEMMMTFAKNAMSRATSILYPFVVINTRLTFGKYASLTAVEGINRSDIPVMLVHGTEDRLVPIDGAGVMGHQKEITNPNVKMLRISTEERNDHGSIFYAKESLAHIKDVDQAYRALHKQYHGKIPEDVKKAFYDEKADRSIYSLPNNELLKEIDVFLAEAVK